jgi:hypothetical protein
MPINRKIASGETKACVGNFSENDPDFENRVKFDGEALVWA